MDVEHELDERVFEASAVSLQEVEPAARHFRTPLEAQDVQVLPQVVVGDGVVGGVVVGDVLAADLDVVRLVFTGRDVVVRDVGHVEQAFVEFCVELFGACLDAVDLAFELLGALDRLLGLVVFARLFELADPAGNFVAPVAQVVAVGFQVAPLLVEFEDRIEVDVVVVPQVESLTDGLGVLADEAPAYHGREFSRHESRCVGCVSAYPGRRRVCPIG